MRRAVQRTSEAPALEAQCRVTHGGAETPGSLAPGVSSPDGALRRPWSPQLSSSNRHGGHLQRCMLDLAPGTSDLGDVTR